MECYLKMVFNSSSSISQPSQIRQMQSLHAIADSLDCDNTITSDSEEKHHVNMLHFIIHK